jgi:predicted permease
MSLIDGLLHRLRVLARGERYANEQAREVEFHLELEAICEAPSNDDSAEPTVTARRKFGNVTYYREEARRVSALGWLDRLHQDTRYALRGLRRQPAFTAMVVVTLALGFGVNAAMFSLLNRLFVHQPDGVVEPQDVRRFYNEIRMTGGILGAGQTRFFDRYEYPQFRAMRNAGVGDDLGLTTEPDSVTVQSADGLFFARQSEVSKAYFSILGLKPALGRFFVGEEDSIASPTPVVVISEYLWRTKFHRSPDVLGTTMTIGRRPFTIVGVAPSSFRGIDLDATDLWVPLNARTVWRVEGTTAWYEQFGLSARMIARVRLPADEARLRAIAQNAMRTTQIPHYSFDPNEKVSTGSLIAGRGPSEPAKETGVFMRVGAVAVFVLVIAVANVVNLLLLRAANRRREIALRRALGVSRSRLTWQLIIEGTLIALVAGTVAVGVAAWSGALLRQLVMPATHWATSPIDLSTATFILCLSLLIGVVSGAAPAFHGLRVPLVDALRAGPSEGSYRRSATRTGLLVLQAALCVVLLVGAGLFAKSLSNVMSIDTGYDVMDVVMVAPVFPPKTGGHTMETARIIPEIARTLESNPAVDVASYAQMSPMRGMRFQAVFLPGGDTLPRIAHDIGPSFNIVSASFFDAAGMHVARGRAFTPDDDMSAPRVAIVGATMAKVVWAGADPIGKCLILGDRNAPCTTIVGVVSDANRMGLVEAHPMMYYVPASQPRDTLYPISTLVIRARPGQAARAQSIASQAVQKAFHNLDGVDSRTMYSVIEREARPWNIGATLFTAFGLLAFVVAGVGVYSIVSYGVAQRTHELGIRIALGATRSQITDLVVGEGLRSVGIGIALGLIASLLLASLVRSLLFGVTPNDASTYIAAATALFALGMVASLIPALRAARIDPMVALRSE